MNWNKLKGKKEQLVILFLVGILLLVIAIPTSEKKEELESEMTTYKANASDTDYVSQLENQLEEVLRDVEGVGEVAVMITIASSSEKIVEKDEETSVQTSSEGGSENSTSTDRRESAVYSGGSGEETPYVVKEISPQISGVLVVAEGGDNAVVIRSITEAVQALFGIDTHKIKVMKHN